MLKLSALKTGQMTVGVVADNEIKRRQILDAMRLLQFRDVRDYRSFFDMTIAVSKREVQWVFCTYRDEQSETLSSYLEQIGKTEAGATVAFSVLVREADYAQVPRLFDLGLMSWHENADAPDEIADRIYRLQKQVDEHHLPAMLAFSYLRQLYRQQMRWQDIIDLSERLLKIFPHEDKIRLTIAEALHHKGDTAQAQGILSRIDYYDPQLAPQIAALRETILKQGDSQHKLLAMQFHMRSAVLVDPIPESRGMIENKLRELGFRDIHVFHSGDGAAEHIAGHAPDLVVIEWRCQGLAGPFLLQRIRQHGYLETPVLVITDSLDRSDIQLVKDMGVAQVLKRPIRPQQFTMAAAWSITQTRAPTEATTIERKLLAALAQGDIQTAKAALRKYEGIEARDPLREKYLHACMLFQERRYLEAKTLLIEATHRSGGDNVQFAAMLAKCLIKLGDYRSALKLLQKVTALSPKNIERLCSLSEVSVQAQEFEIAKKTIDLAESLDPDSPQVQQSAAKVAAVTGETQKAVDLMKNLKHVEDVVAFMNNLAISHVRTGDLAEGISLYRRCLRVIPDTSLSLQAVVAYNLGLTMVKNDDIDQAAYHLKQAISAGPSKVRSKAESLHRRIQESRRQGGNVRLVLNTPAERGANSEHTIGEDGSTDVEQAELRERLYFLRGQVLRRVAS